MYWEQIKNKFCHWLVLYIPPRIVYWCAIHVSAFATTGKYSEQVVPELLAVTAADRWYDGHTL